MNLGSYTLSSSSAIVGVLPNQEDLKKSKNFTPKLNGEIIRPNSTFSSISSLIDANDTSQKKKESITNNTNNTNDKDSSYYLNFYLNEKLSTAQELFERKLRISGANDTDFYDEELPILCLATDNSIEAYYNTESAENTGQLITSKTISSSGGCDEIEIVESSTTATTRPKPSQDLKKFIGDTTNLGGGSNMISRRFLNKLSAEMVLNYIRKRKSFLKSNSLTCNGKENKLQEEEIIGANETNEGVEKTVSVEKNGGDGGGGGGLERVGGKAVKGKSSGSNKGSLESGQSRTQIVLHNKPPIWNENSQVYQLDFGGRVTQESAKNFQVEYCGKQVMQFGRIDTNAYTLDFEWPFTAIQAFSIALANITQRLK